MITHQLAKSPIEWEGKFVKGHQDDKYTAQILDEWAIGNVLADQNTKQELQSHRRVEESAMMEGESWRLYKRKIHIREHRTSIANKNRGAKNETEMEEDVWTR